MKFFSRVEQHGKTATGVPVPAEVIEQLGAGKRAKVLVTLGTHTYPSSLGSFKGVPMLPLSAENRARAGVQPGDDVEVDIAVDTAQRHVVMPEDLAAALAAHPGSEEAFRALSYSNQRQRAEAVTAAKKPETRERRIAGIVAELTVA